MDLQDLLGAEGGADAAALAPGRLDHKFLSPDHAVLSFFGSFLRRPQREDGADLFRFIKHHIQEKENEKVNDVVDGQQRLVTLSLILRAIGDNSKDIQRFLKNRYESNEALLNIRDNMEFIRQYIKDESKLNKLKANINSLCFSVLTIKNTENLDLAFTFFSNTNSRGKKLTDYDLLKPHHLRYIPSELEEQQMHLAKKWDSMISSQREKEKHHSKEIDYKRLIEFCLYRLRKWSAWENEDLSVDHYIKKEFDLLYFSYHFFFLSNFF